MINVGKNEKYDKGDIADLLSAIIYHVSQNIPHQDNFWKAYSERMGFNNIEESKRFQACVDLTITTESAIVNAFEYQLGDLSKNESWGEKYLRLYGILNAIYLQSSALKGIGELLKFPSTEQQYSKIQKLDIYDLRKVAGAHTVDYTVWGKSNEGKKTQEKNSYRIVDIHLKKTGNRIQALDESNKWKEFNLLQGLAEYQVVSIPFTQELVAFAIEKFVTKKSSMASFKKDLKFYSKNLVDYSSLDKNKDYRKNLLKKVERSIKSNSEFLESLIMKAK
ncbi:MAG TPA: hypothetical protein PLN13_09260 [Bacteroidia bacterium]|nr:hypothetical protein [Bacteroidia bacterium]HRH08756.1 hypothetical protein [Bacteroidia bacterium]